MTASTWTEDRVDRLKILWNEGLTAEEVARDLANGITRSAVLGKVYRMGLSAGRDARPAKTAGKVRPTAAASPARPTVAGRAAGEPGRPLETGQASVLTVGRRECRWPLGDPRSPGFTLCGQPVVRGAYCAGHAGIAYRPAPEVCRGLERLASLV